MATGCNADLARLTCTLSPKRATKCILFHLLAVGLAVPTFRWDCLVLLLLMLFSTICLGFTVGMHRGVIHRSYRTHKWLENALAYLFVLTSLGGPINLVRMHNVREHFQNSSSCPSVFGYRRSFFGTFRQWWMYNIDVPQGNYVPDRIAGDPFFRWLDRTFFLHQIPVAILLFACGGWPYVVWGAFIRIVVTAFLFICSDHLGHTRGYKNFALPTTSEEGRNNLIVGVVQFGEGWHNNHHACPESACMGLKWWELDLGYLVIRLLGWMGLVWDVKTHKNVTVRPEAIQL